MVSKMKIRIYIWKEKKEQNILQNIYFVELKYKCGKTHILLIKK